jgi:hypothetical protein
MTMLSEAAQRFPVFAPPMRPVTQVPMINAIRPRTAAGSHLSSSSGAITRWARMAANAPTKPATRWNLLRIGFVIVADAPIQVLAVMCAARRRKLAGHWLERTDRGTIGCRIRATACRR